MSKHKEKHIQTSTSDKVFSGIVAAIITLFCLFCFIPFWLVLINSFATEAAINANGFSLWPTEFSLDAYQYLFRGDQLLRSYSITFIVTAAGTLCAVIISAMMAYLISHPKVKYRNQIGFMVYFTMIFGSGIVGFYLMIATWLNLKDNILALVLPYLMNPFYVFIIVNYFRSLPKELSESAEIDGANDIRTFFTIILPVSKPVMATVSLFYALVYWNDWWLALLFIDNYKLHPLQMMIRKLMSNVNAAQYIGGATNIKTVVPALSMQLAIVCLTIGPIVLLYPMVQKYFVKGIMVGAVKG